MSALIWSCGKNHHHHHHVLEGLGVFPVPWSSRWSSPFHLFLGRPMFLRPFGYIVFGYILVLVLVFYRVTQKTGTFEKPNKNW